MVVDDSLRELPPGVATLGWMRVINWEKVKYYPDNSKGIGNAATDSYRLSFRAAPRLSSTGEPTKDRGLALVIEGGTDSTRTSLSAEEFRQGIAILAYERDSPEHDPRELSLEWMTEKNSAGRLAEERAPTGGSMSFYIMDDDSELDPAKMEALEIRLPAEVETGEWRKTIPHAIPLPTSCLLPQSEPHGPRGPLSVQAEDDPRFTFELLGVQPFLSLCSADLDYRPVPFYAGRNEEMTMGWQALGWVSVQSDSGVDAAWILCDAAMRAVTDRGEVMDSLITDAMREMPASGQYEPDRRAGAVVAEFEPPRTPADRWKELVVRPRIAVVTEWAEADVPVTWNGSSVKTARNGPAELIADPKNLGGDALAVVLKPDGLLSQPEFYGAVQFEVYDKNGLIIPEYGGFTMDNLWDRETWDEYDMNGDNFLSGTMAPQPYTDRMVNAARYWQNDFHRGDVVAFIRVRLVWGMLDMTGRLTPPDRSERRRELMLQIAVPLRLLPDFQRRMPGKDDEPDWHRAVQLELFGNDGKKLDYERTYVRKLPNWPSVPEGWYVLEFHLIGGGVGDEAKAFRVRVPIEGRVERQGALRFWGIPPLEDPVKVRGREEVILKFDGSINTEVMGR